MKRGFPRPSANLLRILWSYGLASLAALIYAAAAWKVASLRQAQAQFLERVQVEREIDQLCSKLEGQWTNPLLVARGLAAEVIVHGDLDGERFAQAAQFLIEQESNVIDVSMTKGTVITEVYPRKGNEAILGRDYRQNRGQWPSVERAIRTQEPVVDGPSQLMQGGVGLIVREPIYLRTPQGGKGRFYGVISVVLDVHRTFEQAGFFRPDLPLKIAIQRQDENGAAYDLILGDPAVLRHNPVKKGISLPLGDWTLAGAPKSGWDRQNYLFTLPQFSLFLLFTAIAFGIAYLADQRERTRRQMRDSREKLLREEQRYRTLLQNAGDGIHITDTNGFLMDASDSFFRMLGYTRDELVGRHASVWDTARPISEVQEIFARTHASATGYTFETKHRRRDGSTFDAEVNLRELAMDGQHVLFSSSRDISERKQAEETIHSLAYYDSLTKLPNRSLFYDRLRTAIAICGWRDSHGAVLFIDFDNFKILNDTLGHSTGDLFLEQAASRLSACVRSEDTVARLGGDEFVVLAMDLGQQAKQAKQEAEGLASRVQNAMSEEFALNGAILHCTCSVGIALFCGAKLSPDEVVKQADIAMYMAKNGGRNAIHFFDPELEKAVKERASLEAQLRKSIQQRDFYLHFQPLVDGAGHPIGAECLLRWARRGQSPISPAQFIPIAEQSGMILPLGALVFEMALAQLASWSGHEALRAFPLAVNVSLLQLKQPNFVEELQKMIARHGVAPSRLKIEITENLMAESFADVAAKIEALKKLGIRFSLDDFGTGYSSLSYLKRLPLDELKIDRSFVRDIVGDAQGKALTQAIFLLGKDLHIEVVAEGVETTEQKDLLEELGCQIFQGYLFGAPTDADSFTAYLLNRLAA